MQIICNTPNPSGAYPAVQQWDNPALPDGYALVPDGFDLSGFYDYNGFVVLTLDGDAVAAMTPDVDAWEAWRASLPPEPDDDYISDSEAIAMLFGEVV